MDKRFRYSFRLIGSWVILVFLCFALRADQGDSTLIPLDGEWRFLLGKTTAAKTENESFHSDSFDAKAYRSVSVPSCWVMQGDEEPHYVNGTESEGFYRKTFLLGNEIKGKRVVLFFGGVWQSAEVWLNGILLGKHDSGFTEFSYDATEAIKPDAPNLLAVRVRQRSQGFRLDTNDDWALPGIFRSVWLEVTPKDLYLESVELQARPDAECRGGTLDVRAFVMRNAEADFFAMSPTFDVQVRMSGPDGREIKEERFSGIIAGSHNGRDVSLHLSVPKVDPWTAETPNLYSVEVLLLKDGKRVHRWHDKVGFRTVSTAGGVLTVNGQPVKLRGVCRHDQHPDVGRATRPEDWVQDLKLMKVANINAIRCSHYPPATGFLRLCDEMGFYVIDEIPFGFGGDYMSDQAYAAGAFLRVYETVKRDRNRPSVIIWSLGNEDPFSALHLAALRSLKGLDSARPVLLPFRFETWLPDEVDILAPHYWKASEYDRAAAISKRPIISTEYSHALGPDDFGEVKERWEALTKHCAGAGAMVWTWADQGLRRPIADHTVLDPMLDKAKYTREGSELVKEKSAGKGFVYDSHGNLGTDGIVDADRNPQGDYWELKAVYSPVRIMTERLAFSRGQVLAEIPVENRYDFRSLRGIRFNWELFIDERRLDAGSTALELAPHTQGILRIPTSALGEVRLGSAAFIHLTICDEEAREITKRSIRLGGYVPSAVQPDPALGTLVVIKQGTLYSVKDGGWELQFDQRGGTLSALFWNGRKLADGVSTVVWRKPTYCERNQLDRRPVQHAWASYLQDLRPELLSWAVREEKNLVIIFSRVRYTEDAANHFDVNYEYRIESSGRVKIDYEVFPKVEVSSLLELGLEWKTQGSLRSATWLGYGIGPSLPNRHEAALFGLWRAGSGTVALQGTKYGIEYLNLDLTDGPRLHVGNLAGFRVEGEGSQQRIRLLSQLAGAWVKGGPPERDEWRLDIKKDQSLTGTIEFQMSSPKNSGQSTPGNSH